MDTCGPVNFLPAMNFIIGGISIDSSQDVHSELLESNGTSLSLSDSLPIILIFQFLTTNTVSLSLWRHSTVNFPTGPKTLFLRTR